MALKILCPLMGSWDSGQWSLRQWFGQNAAYFAVFAQGYLKGKDARDEGLIYAQRSMIHLNPSNDGVELFLEGTHLSRIYMCIKYTFLRIFIASQEFLNFWIHTQRIAACRGAS